MIAMLSREGRTQLLPSQGYDKAPSLRFWKGPGRPEPLTKYLADIIKYWQMLENTVFCWEVCATIGSIQVPG